MPLLYVVPMQYVFVQGIQPPVLIFVQSKDRAKDLFHELVYDGINVDVIHADRTQQQVPRVWLTAMALYMYQLYWYWYLDDGGGVV